jgi:hypothetical protein
MTIHKSTHLTNATLATPMPKQRCKLRSAVSTCWSTMLPAFTLATSAGFSAKADRLRRSGQAMWCGFPPARAQAWALPTTAMTHIAIQEKKDGKVVDWMEQVPEKQYHKENWARN